MYSILGITGLIVPLLIIWILENFANKHPNNFNEAPNIIGIIHLFINLILLLVGIIGLIRGISNNNILIALGLALPMAYIGFNTIATGKGVMIFDKKEKLND
jgi:hypothetical protein